MTRSELIKRITFAIDGYVFGEWDLIEAGARISRLISEHADVLAGLDPVS